MKINHESINKNSITKTQKFVDDGILKTFIVLSAIIHCPVLFI
jgi:hypothetical protein